MSARPFDDAATAFNDGATQFDGCLLVNFDDPTVAFNEPLVDFNGCDNRVVVVPPVTPQTSVPGGGRRGPYQPLPEPLTVRDILLREDEELMAVF